MEDIEIHAKSDRELLIMIVERINPLCKKVDRVDKAVHGNGVPGLKAQVWVLWGIFILGGSAVFINYLRTCF